jgi:hypothetical protein
MIFDSGCSTSIIPYLQSFFDQDQKREQEQRDIQELHTIRVELYYRLADLAEEDNPNIIVGTIHQEFREVFEDHLDERVFETFQRLRALHNYHYIHCTRGKERADGTFSIKYRLVKQPAAELALWQAFSHPLRLQHQRRIVMEDRKRTSQWILMWGLVCLTMMVALRFPPKN